MFADVKEAFVRGRLDEATLKAALVREVNKLLDPVRKHFSENAQAKALLAQIVEWKKADLKPPTGLKRPIASRVAAVACACACDASKPVWAVVAPAANEGLTLGELCTVLRQLQAAPAGDERILLSNLLLM